MCSDVAIRVTNISKCYQIYDKPQHRLLQGLFRGRKQFYREFWALKDVSFEVKKGETVGIIGRNGSGKSTLLQLICGILTPTAGELEIRGRVAALLELGAGFNPEFTGRENAYMNAAIMGLSSEEIDARFDDIAAFADIGEFIDQPVKSYSSGMYMRLAFAVAAHLDADILIVDEALAVGDAFFTQKCMRFLRKFRESGAILFVSHDSASVINLCHRSIWLDKGSVQRTGTAKEVCEAYLEAYFETQQGPSTVARVDNKKPAGAPQQGALQDQRLKFINSSPLRNDIEIFVFNPDKAAFGKGGARITNVNLVSETGDTLVWVVGGEMVCLTIQVKMLQDISSLIIGFIVKDKLGQALFSDNTYLTYAGNPQCFAKEEMVEARFSFQMPILPAGEYSLAAAIAEGTQDNHVQHHWIHDAMIFKSHSSSVCTGLVGVPMSDISIRKI
ncbi:MAG: ABC transporter ATP-binding protein [Gammaproteobacteria bacterium]|nr:MAG: ABC transporter ATP-binding protein [Gammaproteobacteria bacterium]